MCRWLLTIQEQLAILSSAMAIMHPDMYRTGCKAMVKLGHWSEGTGQEDILSVLPIWPSIYNVASVVVNRASPVHLDIQGRSQWLDLLTIVGEYWDLDLTLPTIGLRLRYDPGTVVALSGQLIHHGLDAAGANRGVVAFYMRDNVHEHLDVGRCNFMEVNRVPGSQ